MGRTTKILEEAILGLDIGSTSSRAVLCSNSGREVVVEHPQKGDYSRYEPGDFSSSCYILDDHENGPYIGNAMDPTRVSTSIKPIFLLLSDIEQDELEFLVQQYPQGDELLRMKNSQNDRDRRGFKKKLMQVLELFFKTLRDQVIAACRVEELRVTSVGITIPGQWPAVVEDRFTAILLKMLLKKGTYTQVSRGDIYYHSETQALGHYIFRHRSELLRQYGSNKGAFLLADFGGQNLNVSSYYVQFGLDGAATFFEMEKSTGVIGGSEMQDYYIGEDCAARYRKAGKPLSPHNKQHLINEFHRQKKELDANHQGTENALTLRCGEILIKLAPERIAMMFDRAMKKPLEKMEDILETWGRSNEPRKPRVIIAGGSARSEALQEKLGSMCDKNGMTPVFVHLESMQTSTRYPSLNIAKGAAYATGNSVPVKTFINRGAAIGVQVRECGETVWNNRGPLLCHMDHGYDQYLEIKQGDELKLICEPFRSQGLKRDDIYFQRAYDIYTLGVFNRGRAMLSATFYPDGEDHEPKLLFKMKWCPGLVHTPSRDEWLYGSFALPLKFHRSSSCILVDENGVENNIPPQMLVHPSVNRGSLRQQPPDSEGCLEPDILRDISMAPDVARLSEDSSRSAVAPFANMQPDTAADPFASIPRGSKASDDNDALQAYWPADTQSQQRPFLSASRFALMADLDPQGDHPMA